MSKKTTAVPPARPSFLSRPLRLGIRALGAPTISALMNPVLGQMLVVAELTALLVIAATALFAAQHVSERAFRLLRWAADRPEPAAPSRRDDEVAS